jgi:predicted  nucleic acid-binding Zn-ribbon protein
MKKFIEIQKFDEVVLTSRKIQEDFPRRLKDAELTKLALESELLEKKAEAEENDARLKELEAERREIQELEKGHPERKKKAQGERQYQAVLKEGETIKQKSELNDESSLKHMQLSESLAETIADLEKRLSPAKDKYAKEKAALERELKNAEKAEKESIAGREELLRALDAGNAELYRSSASAHYGRVLAPVEGGKCKACNMNIPPQTFNELQRMDSIRLCPNCHRIMYWAQHPEWAPPAPPKAEEPEPKKTRKYTKRSASSGKN